ncbi:MAG: tRNA epoxyqueuosine(34) reductase QueG [Bacilli bacterium]
MNEEYITLGLKLGFDEVGFTSVNYLNNLEEIYNKQDKLQYKTSFQTGKTDDKIFKSNKYSKYNSAIVVLMSYQNSKNYINNLKENDLYFSSHVWGEDYHIVLKNKLDIMSSSLLNEGYVSEIFVDNNELDERALAYNAGLGYFGLNNLLFNDKLGSYFFIGVILTDAKFIYGKKLNKTCLKCNKCINACPTGSIGSNNILNGNTCLSYITQKRNITLDEEKKLNNCVYGCDVCSNVCPLNDNISKSDNFNLEEKDIIIKDEFLSMSQEEFNSKYKNSSIFWRGKKIVERNVTKSRIKN